MPTLHITNGDSAAGTLRSFLPDPVVITADPLFDGPASAGDDDAWYAQRARQLATGDDAVRRTGAQLASWDSAVDAAVKRGDQIVLWFEHDLFDQLLLIRMLDRIGRAPRQTAGAISLICIDSFPGIDRFIGLGQLSAEQLASLVDRGAPVTPAQFEHASAAWKAFRSADPRGLLRLMGPGPLPFLGAALRRFLEEYPSTGNGLSRSAQQVLQVLADDGSVDAGRVFVASQLLEENPFIGDWGLFDVVRSLANARVPLVTINPPSSGKDLRGHAVAITSAGREVRAGRQDCVALNGIDQWRGGVHLLGERTSPWRWDDARQTLISLKA